VPLFDRLRDISDLIPRLRAKVVLAMDADGVGDLRFVVSGGVELAMDVVGA
jgi:hypothetical protein